MPVTFDAANQTYTANGKTVAPKAVRKLMDADTDATAARMADIGRRFQSGEITRLQFRKQMQSQIASAQVAASAAGSGGWESMTPKLWGRAGSVVRAQHKWLEGLISDCADPAYLQGGAFLTRLQLYAEAQRGTFEAARNASCREAGFTTATRTLHPEDEHNCQDCIDYADHGPYLIDEVPAIGDSQCQVRCRCSISYSKDIGI